MSALSSLHAELGTRYSYNPQAPLFDGSSYLVYQALHIDLKMPVTLKLLQHPSPDLAPYLKKLKDCKVENVIKIYEIHEAAEAVFVATERVAFADLKFALSSCRKLDDFDAVFMSKLILAAHLDMLRAGLSWFGTEQDIEFTENGLRLSWNNSIPFQSENPFPLILSRLAGKLDSNDQKMLPFPKSRVLEDLIALSSQSASEIALSNHMKKREKQSKKRGRNWLCLKEYKNDFEYYQEVVYFAVHKEAGFARVKSFAAGKVSEELACLNRNKSSFTRLIQSYEEQGRSYMASEYSNGGSLFNYVNKLKANAVALKEEQIEFFFYSLFEPLKLIQDSPIRSLCMLHIKNIYIENGIPKIGEPVPLNAQLIDQLRDKADLPDFYHSAFKRNPDLKANTYDTYSLGVLMYKLMYTEYPIFPQGKVHIPTAPSYNPRLKTTLQILLDEGGQLKELEKKIQVSEEVAKQVKLNKGKLLKQKSQRSGKGGAALEQDEDIQKEEPAQKKEQEEDNTEGHLEEAADQYQDQDCCKLCCAQLEDPVKRRSLMLDSLEESPYACYRLTTKATCVLAIYIFVFYLSFLKSSLSLLSSHSSLARTNVTIWTLNYEITTADSSSFYKTFNLTDKSVGSLESTGCFINSYNGTADYAAVALKSSHSLYLVFGVLGAAVILLVKLAQLAKFDLIKTLYNMSNVRANFNMSNYIIFNLIFCSFVNDHYVFFNQVFNSVGDACLGVRYSYNFGSTECYFGNPSAFSTVFVSTLIAHLLLLLLHLGMIVRTESVRYTRIFNPILLLLPFLVAYTVIVRVGVLSNYFYPSLMKNVSVLGGFFQQSSYVNIIGVIPEMLFLVEFLVEMIVDWLFWLTFDKRRRMLINDLSSAGIII